MRRKIKAKRKAELNEKKMLRKVKQANRKICKFGYDSSSRLRGRSAHRKFRGGNSSGEESPSHSEDSVEDCSCLESFEADSIDSGSEIMGGMSSMVRNVSGLFCFKFVFQFEYFDNYRFIKERWKQL